MTRIVVFLTGMIDFDYRLYIECWEVKKLEIKPQNDEYVLAISFFDYLNEKSGTPRVMLAHQEMFLQEKISYVGIFSIKKMMFCDHFMLFCMYGLIVDGKFVGIFQMNQIIRMFLNWNNDGIRMISIHIHHLMYTKWKTVSCLVDSFSNVPIKIYLHDYYLACLNFNLLIDGKKYCGGVGINEATCKDCNSYKASKKHEKKVKALLSRWGDRCQFVSPSKATKEIFGKFYPEWYSKVLIIPHQKYEKHYKGNLELIDQDETIRVAFLGLPLYHKGWAVWQEIVANVPMNSYKFYVFNSNNDRYEKLNMEKVKIEFTQNNLNAMTDALREHKIHVAVLWSVCSETYSYTCNEAFSANAFIITNKLSGNIRDMVMQNKNGIVLEDEQELIQLFKNTDFLRDMLNKYRSTTKGGPEFLQENDTIVDVVKKEKNFGNVKIRNCQNILSRITNTPLLWLLNKTYKLK